MTGIPLEERDLTIARIAFHTNFGIDTISSGAIVEPPADTGTVFRAIAFSFLQEIKYSR